MFLDQMSTDQSPCDYDRIIKALNRRLRQQQSKTKSIGKRKWQRERYFRKRIAGLKALVKKLSGKCSRLEAENHVLRIKLRRLGETTK